jgi:hypothetical protein
MDRAFSKIALGRSGFLFRCSSWRSPMERQRKAAFRAARHDKVSDFGSAILAKRTQRPKPEWQAGEGEREKRDHAKRRTASGLLAKRTQILQAPRLVSGRPRHFWQNEPNAAAPGPDNDDRAGGFIDHLHDGRIDTVQTIASVRSEP